MKFPPRIDSLLQRVLPAWVDRVLLAKAMSFAVVGCINAVLHISTFSLCYYGIGLPIAVANVLAWCVAVTNSYIMNSMVTFAEESGRRLNLKAFASFAATQIAGLIASTITIYAVALLVPPWFAKMLRVDPVFLGLLCAIGTAFVVDFALSHLVVFRRREQTPHH
jgi:putative flippase GtrA